MRKVRNVYLVQVHISHPLIIRRDRELPCVCTFEDIPLIAAIRFTTIELFVRPFAILVIDAFAIAAEYRIVAFLGHKFFGSAIRRHRIDSGFYSIGIAHYVVAAFLVVDDSFTIR